MTWFSVWYVFGLGLVACEAKRYIVRVETGIGEALTATLLVPVFALLGPLNLLVDVTSCSFCDRVLCVKIAGVTIVRRKH